MSRRHPVPDEFDDLSEVLDLWREDAALAAARAGGPEELADRVLARVERRPRPPLAATAGARWYAAAAVVLFAVGVIGTVVTRVERAEAQPAPRWAAVEDDITDAVALDPRLAPSLVVEDR